MTEIDEVTKLNINLTTECQSMNQTANMTDFELVYNQRDYHFIIYSSIDFYIY